MLAIGERPAVERLTRLEDLAISALADRRRIQAQHAGECQSAPRQVAAGHAHPPIRHDEFPAAPRTALMIELGEHDAILHEVPATVCRHVHLYVIVCGVLRHRRGGNYREAKRPQRQHDLASTQTHTKTPFHKTHVVRPRISSDAQETESADRGV